MLEIPNSEDDKTATALRFASFLPEHRIEILPESLEFTHHRFCNPEGTVIEAVDYAPLKFVCKFLRARQSQITSQNTVQATSGFEMWVCYRIPARWVLGQTTSPYAQGCDLS